MPVTAGRVGDTMTEEWFKECLKSHIAGVTAESCEVRAHSLTSLQLLLHSNQKIINLMVLGRLRNDLIILFLIILLILLASKLKTANIIPNIGITSLTLCCAVSTKCKLTSSPPKQTNLKFYP